MASNDRADRKLIDRCSNPYAGLRALKHYSTSCADLASDPYNMLIPSTFGDDNRRCHQRAGVSLPAGFLPEALDAIGLDLATVDPLESAAETQLHPCTFGDRLATVNEARLEDRPGTVEFLDRRISAPLVVLPEKRSATGHVEPPAQFPQFGLPGH